jgi:putative ABC transport system permease protein
MLSENSKEIERFNLKKSLKTGRIPVKKNEILISHEFFQKLGINLGDPVTLISSTMYGGMAIYNFHVAGTVEFGSAAMDRGSIIADIRDVRQALNMKDATGELLGFFKNDYFDQEKADRIIADFNSKYNDQEDEFSPLMVSLRDQSNMAMFVDFADAMGGVISAIFIFAMSLVLWNAGLLGGLRRYGEFGVRLAIGEEKNHLYKTLIYESLIVGIIGSVIGSIAGIGLSVYLEKHGFDTSGMMKDATIMMPTVFRAKVTTASYYLGFIPGVLSTTIGSMLAGIGIYKRQTAQLFKQLET